MNAIKTESSPEPAGLVRWQRCLEIIFPDADNRPSKNTFLEWKRRGYFPFLKIGKSVYMDPSEVRAALDRQFKVQKRWS